MIVTLLLFLIWCALIVSGGGWAIAAVAWIGVGVWMVNRSQSRGVAADAGFVLTWPIHLVLHWMGWE